MHASIDNMQIYFLFHQKPIKKHFFCSNIQESHLTAEKNLLYEVSLVRKNENQLLSKLFLRFGDIKLYKNPPSELKVFGRSVTATHLHLILRQCLHTFCPRVLPDSGTRGTKTLTHYGVQVGSGGIPFAEILQKMTRKRHLPADKKTSYLQLWNLLIVVVKNCGSRKWNALF